MGKRAAIVLAGGCAQRFQVKNQPWQDKALEDFQGKPLLVHLVNNILPAVDKVLISVKNFERKMNYTQVLNKHGLSAEFIVDQKGHDISGPVVAIMSGLQECDAESCLIVPVDMPFLKWQVADFIFSLAEGFDVAVPVWPGGVPETLLMILNRSSGMDITSTLCALGMSRADSILRGASKLLLVSPLKEIKFIDPDLRSFININQRKDLANLQTRSTEGKINKDIEFKRQMSIYDLSLLREAQRLLRGGRCQQAKTGFSACVERFESHEFYFWAGVSAEKLAQIPTRLVKDNENFLRAARNFRAEADIYKEKGCKVLAERALADTIRYESMISP